MIGLALIPLATFLLFFVVVHHYTQRGEDAKPQGFSLRLCAFAPLRFFSFTGDGRSSFTRAALIWGCYLVIITEMLSLVRGISPVGLAIAWALPLIAATGWLAWHIRNSPVKTPAAGFDTAQPAKDWGSRILIIGVVAILAITALVAWVTPPQTYDSLNYHLPRVAHWAQERAVVHFATGIGEQNVISPGSELIILHLYVLAGSDRLANFAAWLSMLGSLVVAAQIAASLGADRRGQLLAMVVTATIPMGIVQASSTMTDYVAAFWTACVAAETLRLWTGPMRRSGLVFVSLAAGLALLAKPTAAVFVLPFGAWVGWMIWRRWKTKQFVNSQENGGWGVLGDGCSPNTPHFPLLFEKIQQFLLWGAVALTLVIGLNAGHLTRNAVTYGNPFGDHARLSLHNNLLRTPQGITSNLIRNAALHSGTPWGRVNLAVYNTVVIIHQWLGLSPEDPRTTSAGPYPWMSVRTDENIAGNLLHAILSLYCLGTAIWARKRLGNTHLIYVLIAASTFILFSILFKWQIYGSRYHMPFFVLFAPAIAYALSVMLRPRLAWLAGMALILLTYPWLFSIDSRPLLPTSHRSYPLSILKESRQKLYFANVRYLEYPYQEIAAYIKDADCNRIGMSISGSSAEYPFWVLLGAPNTQRQIEWLISGPSDRHTQPDFQPCAVICEGCDQQVEYRGLPLVFHYDTFRLYLQPQP